MKKEFYRKEKQKAEKLIEKVKYWKKRYNDCFGFKEEWRMDLKVIDWRMKAERHIEELVKILGSLKVVFDNDSKRLEIAKILMLYKKELNLEVRNSSQT